jgi:sulfite reductase (ferredoxin)
LRYILNDFEANANGNHFRLLCSRRKVFLRILKPLDTTNLVDADFIDWGNADNYVKLLE